MQPEKTHENKKPQDHKNGHQTILKSFIRDKAIIEIQLDCPPNHTHSEKILGRVTQFDNYTITIQRVVIVPGGTVEKGLRTYFKSSIQSFGAYNV